jgi:hypothetical protein
MSSAAFGEAGEAVRRVIFDDRRAICSTSATRSTVPEVGPGLQVHNLRCSNIMRSRKIPIICHFIDQSAIKKYEVRASTRIRRSIRFLLTSSSECFSVKHTVASDER